MKIIHRGKLKHVDLTLAVGDLFETEVNAIVSSEQMDFVLSGNPTSISGQIWDRYGHTVQDELDEYTKGQVLRAGTVIETGGGGDFTRILHAGFHDPEDWPGMPGGSQEADYFAAIGTCIRQVLEPARTQNLSSVAFPLIGCGLFGLDEKMLILQFLDAIEVFDNRLKDGECINVWLVIRDSAQFESVVAIFIELLLRSRTEMVLLELDRTGVPFLDRFAARIAQRSNEEWVKWHVCRFTEIALEIMCYGLSQLIRPLPTPQTLFGEGQAPTFGLFREIALKFAYASPERANVWGATFFKSVLRDRAAAQALEEVNAQRNHLAHGRKSLGVAEIKKLAVQSLRLQAWPQIPDKDGELILADWHPWVVSSPSNGQPGLFERWQKNAIRYLVPDTGVVFNVRRS